MAKRIKETVDVSKLFNAALLSSQQQQEIIRSESWPIIVAAYSKVEGDLRVHDVENTGNTIIYHLTNSQGITTAAVTKSGDEFNFLTADSPLATHNPASTLYYTRQATSKHAAYLVSKLRKDSDLSHRLKRSTVEIHGKFSSIMRSAVDTTVDKIAKSSVTVPRIELNNGAQIALSKLLVGDCTVHDIPVSVRQHISDAYKNYSTKANHITASINGALDCFSSPKFMFVPMYNRGILLGAISPQPMIAALETYRNGDSLPDGHSFNYCDFTMKPTWYPSIESLPDNVRSELEISLLMFKSHTGVDDLMSRAAIMNNDKALPEINAYLWAHYNYSPLLVLDR